MSPNQFKQISVFREFAIDQLTCHLHELNTNYRNKPGIEPGLVSAAYEDHRKIFEQEMEERKIALSAGEDVSLFTELERLKVHYLTLLTETDHNKRSTV